jgi:anaerobic magnesium-protoporphyrin IX monomethyl ester cyclase
VASPHVALVRPALRVARAAYSTLACPPLALAYLAASLRAHDVRVTIIDAVGEAPHQWSKEPDPRFLSLGLSDRELCARIPADVTLIGVTSMFSESWPRTRESLRGLRRAFPGIPLVVGGEHATALPELTLSQSGADACVLGEGEDTIVELVAALENRQPLTGVCGLAYLEEGRLRRTPPRARIRAVAAIPRPAWELLPIEAYLARGLGFGIGRGRSLPILATRGCPYQCTFCSSPQMWTTRWIAREPEDVLDEMEQAVLRFGVENFDFYDLTAILKKEWIVKFCKELVQRKLDVTWQIPSGTRSEALDAETLDHLKRAGVRHIVYAPESGSPAVLARIKKRVKLDRLTASIQAAVRAGLRIKCNFIVGFPDETFEEAMQTVRYCQELARIGVDDVNLGPFCPYPGSELYDGLVRDGRLGTLDDAYFDMLAMYADLGRTTSWSKHMSDRQVVAARHLGMSLFYARAFVRRPSRLLEVPVNVVTGRHRTRLDRALGDMIRRFVDAG